MLGAIADWTSYEVALGVNAALIGLAAVFFLTARETLERPTPSEEASGEPVSKPSEVR
jgi:hypothetical protein